MAWYTESTWKERTAPAVASIVAICRRVNIDRLKKRAFAVHHPSPFFSFRETVPIERFSRCSGLHETPRRFCYTSNSWETYCFTQGLGSGEHEGDSVYFSSGKVVLMNCSRFYSLWPDKGEGRLELIGILHLWSKRIYLFNSFRILIHHWNANIDADLYFYKSETVKETEFNW